MVYMKVKITITDKELIVNPNCPIKLLYNFIQSELVAAHTKKPFSESKVALAGSMSVASTPKKEESHLKGLTRHRSSSKSSTGNRSVSKILSITRQDMPPNQEFDLIDEKGNFKQIYCLDPWVNGWETGIFAERATYYVVTFDREFLSRMPLGEPPANIIKNKYKILASERHLVCTGDEKGSMINLQIMAPKSTKHYSDLMSRIRRQSRRFSKQRFSEEIDNNTVQSKSEQLSQ